MREFSHLKDHFINSNMYIACVVDGEFKSFTVDSEELDKDLSQLEADLALQLNTTPDKVKVYNLAIIEQLRPQEELQQFWEDKQHAARLTDHND